MRKPIKYEEWTGSFTPMNASDETLYVCYGWSKGDTKWNKTYMYKGKTYKRYPTKALLGNKTKIKQQ